MPYGDYGVTLTNAYDLSKTVNLGAPDQWSVTKADTMEDVVSWVPVGEEAPFFSFGPTDYQEIGSARWWLPGTDYDAAGNPISGKALVDLLEQMSRTRAILKYQDIDGNSFYCRLYKFSKEKDDPGIHWFVDFTLTEIKRIPPGALI